MNAIITGSNRGIGNCMVHAFAEKGYNIWACARRQNDEFEREMRELSERTGREITPIYFDLSSEDELKKGVKEILAAKKPIDVLINNAGMI
ncbi:MAG: SDR family NAD(P)-dependent oxidoreductase, partial [Ruminiclostridium sp.]|nr:SDR family NAD(P)-dependent oxidoreductase [Ruminiclostridium sp.]